VPQFAEMNPFSSSGVVLLPAGAGGTVVSGIVIEKLRLSCRQIIRIQTILVVGVTAACFLFFLVCSSIPFAGVNMSYNVR
jgi:hypothetical protein